MQTRSCIEPAHLNILSKYVCTFADTDVIHTGAYNKSSDYLTTYIKTMKGLYFNVSTYNINAVRAGGWVLSSILYRMYGVRQENIALSSNVYTIALRIGYLLA